MRRAGKKMVETIHNLTHEVAQIIGRAIVNEVAPWDTFTTTKAISEKYKVSINTIREALGMLYAKGLLSIDRRNGVSVSPLANWNLFDTDVLNWMAASKNPREFLKEICELRLAVEPEAARLAAQNTLTIKMAATFRQSLRQLGQAIPGSNDMLEGELNFLKTILFMSGNPYFIQMEKILTKAIHLKFVLLNRSSITPNTAIADYCLLFDAIDIHNADLAFQVARRMAGRDLNLAKSFIEQRNAILYESRDLQTYPLCLSN